MVVNSQLLDNYLSLVYNFLLNETQYMKIEILSPKLKCCISVQYVVALLIPDIANFLNFSHQNVTKYAKKIWEGSLIYSLRNQPIWRVFFIFATDGCRVLLRRFSAGYVLMQRKQFYRRVFGILWVFGCFFTVIKQVESFVLSF